MAARVIEYLRPLTLEQVRVIRDRWSRALHYYHEQQCAYAVNSICRALNTAQDRIWWLEHGGE